MDGWYQRYYTVQPLTGTDASKQRSWDIPLIDATFNSLYAAQPDDYHRARFSTVKALHNGIWLNALPIILCGLRMEEDAFASLSASAWVPVCSNPINAYVVGLTWLIREAIMTQLSCKNCAGRTLRHNYLNDLICHAQLQAGPPSIKKPAGLLRTDSEWLDSLTNVPWQAGKSIVWNVTVTDTLADSYLASTSMTAAAAAEFAATRKESQIF